MTIRSAAWLAAALVTATAAPAFAQDGVYDPGPPPPLPEWEESWEEYPDEAYDEEPRWEEPGPHGEAHDAWASYAEQRAQWLAQCRATYYDERGRRRGEVIGGVLGAVAGGVAGNRIADGERLGGTLIGAGVGGLAGAAIGGAIGSESDSDRVDECESYLLRHEQGYRGPVYAQAHGYPQGHAQGAYGYHYPYPYPVMWVKVPIVTERRGCGCETVVEEWVEEEEATPPPARRAKIRRVAPAPAPAPGKRLRASK